MKKYKCTKNISHVYMCILCSPQTWVGTFTIFFSEYYRELKPYSFHNLLYQISHLHIFLPDWIGEEFIDLNFEVYLESVLTVHWRKAHARSGWRFSTRRQSILAKAKLDFHNKWFVAVTKYLDHYPRKDTRYIIHDTNWTIVLGKTF